MKCGAAAVEPDPFRRSAPPLAYSALPCQNTIMSLFSTMAPTAVLLAGAGVLVVFYRGLSRRRQAAALRFPGAAAARSPGREILAQAEQVAQAVEDTMSGGLAFLALFAGVLAAGAAFGPPGTRLTSTALSGAAGILLLGLGLINWLRLKRLRAEFMRRHGGRVEVARALDALEPLGYRLFHDLGVGGLNLHHVVVCRKGVFVVETTSGAGPPRLKGGGKATVDYNGHVLIFPRRTDEKTLREAQARAERLAQWLGQEVGEAVAVRAVVAVPGWYVKRTSSEGIPVVHPSQVGSLFKYIKPQSLSDELLGCVVHRLEQAV